MLQVFAVEQNVTFEYLGINYLLVVTNLLVTDKVGDQVEARRAQLVPSTAFIFEVPPNSGLKLAGQHSNVAPQLFKHKEFNFEKLGIGGLDNQFEQIFRRAFASRVFPPSVVERLGIHHVKGVLLFGPPGTGVIDFTSARILLQKAQLCFIALLYGQGHISAVAQATQTQAVLCNCCCTGTGVCIEYLST